MKEDCKWFLEEMMNFLPFHQLTQCMYPKVKPQYNPFGARVPFLLHHNHVWSYLSLPSNSFLLNSLHLYYSPPPKIYRACTHLFPIPSHFPRIQERNLFLSLTSQLPHRSHPLFIIQTTTKPCQIAHHPTHNLFLCQ